MALYWISYDLDKPGQDYSDLINRLKELKASRILLSDWLLSHSGTTPEAIRNDLGRYLDNNDRIMVAELRNNAAWNRVLVPNDTVQSLFRNAV